MIGDLLLDVFMLRKLTGSEQTEGLVLRPGGSGANTAAWLAHLGVPVTFVGCVGRDVCGEMLRQDLERRRVVTRVRSIAEMETGAVAISIRSSGRRVMRSSRGANAALSPDDLAALSHLALDVVHLSGYALLGRWGTDVFEAAARLAAASKARLSFDPSSVGVITRLGARDLLQLCARLNVEILLPNRREAAAMAGLTAVDAAASVLGEFVPQVVVKDGARGSVHPAGQGSVRMRAQRAAAMDTTGAGDAFDAGVLAALSCGEGLESAARRGHDVAFQVVQHVGGRPESL